MYALKKDEVTGDALKYNGNQQLECMSPWIEYDTRYCLNVTLVIGSTTYDSTD
jgi:hypothetical protein